MSLQPPQPLASHHATASFDCGDTILNQWLRQRAMATQRSGATRTFVVCDAEEEIKTYVALAPPQPTPTLC